MIEGPLDQRSIGQNRQRSEAPEDWTHDCCWSVYININNVRGGSSNVIKLRVKHVHTKAVDSFPLGTYGSIKSRRHFDIKYEHPKNVSTLSSFFKDRQGVVGTFSTCFYSIPSRFWLPSEGTLSNSDPPCLGRPPGIVEDWYVFCPSFTLTVPPPLPSLQFSCNPE
jgi:hypothetical protein